MGKRINFGDLKQQKIYATVGDIEIYNPTEDVKKLLMEIIFSNINKDGTINDIDGKTVMMQLVPVMTNIYLPDDEELIQQVIENPSDDLLDVIGHINELVEKFTDRTNKTLEQIQKLPKAERNKILGIEDEKTKRLNRLREIENERKALLEEVELVEEVDETDGE